ncbi:hypothetical protein [Duganella phyllosphaerae]|uniref:hypothetical protein n=1 Tax=Duganella phyllosphaerae TaxID=762836 RepID=UPI00114C8A70|nr:hypothetical protein [Duganella phyllosphaerae]
MTIAVSLFTCAIFVESFCLPEVNRFKSAQVFGLGAIGLVSYLAHGQAGEEVNAIFRQDASAFPYTTTAATAMTIASWAFWPVIIVYLLVLAHLIWRVTKFDEKHAFAMTMVIVNMASFVSFIEHQTRDDGNRKGNLYKIALAMDFNNYFRCANATERTNHVAFIGSDQKRAIVAPKLVMRNNNPAGFSTVEIPAHFPLTTCD